MENELICEDCRKECSIRLWDNSFDHPFGTQIIKHYASDCCEAPIYNSMGRELDQQELFAHLCEAARTRR